MVWQKIQEPLTEVAILLRVETQRVKTPVSNSRLAPNVFDIVKKEKLFAMVNLNLYVEIEWEPKQNKENVPIKILSAILNLIHKK